MRVQTFHSAMSFLISAARSAVRGCLPFNKSEVVLSHSPSHFATSFCRMPASQSSVRRFSRSFVNFLAMINPPEIKLAHPLRTRPRVPVYVVPPKTAPTNIDANSWRKRNIGSLNLLLPYLYIRAFRGEQGIWLAGEMRPSCPCSSLFLCPECRLRWRSLESNICPLTYYISQKPAEMGTSA